MPALAITRSFLTIGLVALVGSGCLDTWLHAAEPHAGDTGSTVSGAAGTSGASTGAAGAPGDAPVTGTMCVNFDEGGPGSCKPYEGWKQSAYERCQQQSLVLTAIAVGPCDGDAQSMTFTCCGGTTTPTPSPPKCGETTDASGQICKTCWDAVTGNVISNDCVPGSTGTGGSSGGPQMCIAFDDGGPTSCKDAATWKRYGSERCAQQNLTLTDVKVVIACDGGSSVVTYVCCALP